MKLTNTYISNNCTKKCLVYCDLNNHYHMKRLVLKDIWETVGVRKFKHIESLHRAVQKWTK